MKLIISDLDGTLFDTSKVNYFAYKRALNEYGYDLDYDFFRRECNGRHYAIFLPKITGESDCLVSIIHSKKKEYYSKYIPNAVPNNNLFDLLEMVKMNNKIALVTTASKENTIELLQAFGKQDLFDLILTQEDVVKPKPDPEGFKKAMDYFNISSNNTIVFEDSEVGVMAATMAGAAVMQIVGFN